jgi:cell division protein YceG involved in septum cleavage
MKRLKRWVKLSSNHEIYRWLRRHLRRPRLNPRLTFVMRSVYGTLLLAAFLFTSLTVFTAITISFPAAEPNMAVAPFPVGVDPERKLISENPDVDRFIENEGRLRWHFPSLLPSGKFAQFIAKLSRSSWYQMAIPGGRLLVVFPGERKEEIAQNFGRLLGWDHTERGRFISLVTSEDPALDEGKFFPERYLVAVDATPENVAQMVNDRFQTEVLGRYTSEAEAMMPLNDALVIASLLQREARDFTDMREISGVIWNRLFIDMPLQLDATLQYARGGRADQPWWPIPVPADKFIDSPFNTYRNKGLPPSAIANPSLEAMVAALNPAETDCLFYFHSKGNFYCSKTYEEHVSKLREIFGRGR